MNCAPLTADGLARLTADGHVVELAAPGAEPVRLHPHPNPDLARRELAAVRAFLATVLSTAQPDTTRMAATSPPL